MQERVKQLVAQMTLEEKASLCSGASMFQTKAISRLSIPAIHMSDGPHGLRKQSGQQDFMGKNESITATCFPAACATGSSFDPELLEEIGRMLGRECQSEDVQVLLGPGVNMKRSPLCGRNFEYFSEDPLVSGTLGSAWVRGLQAEGVGASLKHFLANNQECRRRTQSSEMDERTMREIYTPAFEQVVKEAEPWTVMASYNKLDGIYATEHSGYLNGLLREEWGFDGLVVSDWAAVHDRAAAVKGGCDLTMPGEPDTDHLLVEAVENGALPETVLDACCERIVHLALRTQAVRRPQERYDFEQAHQLARRTAAQSMVLLKNDNNLLPLDASKRIALIGKFAAEPRYQGSGSSRVNPYRVPSMLEVTAGMPNVVYAEGFGFGGSGDPEKLAEAVRAAEEADIAVIFAGLPAAMESEGFDRWIMKLPVCQNELIEAVCSVQPNTVVVLQNGAPVELPWVERPKAILEVYLGGEAVSEAIWDVLTGVESPSGRLAESFPLRLQDNPSYLFWPGEGDRVEYREGVFVGYRYYCSREMAVRYPFGHGLTYTTFAYDALCLSRETFSAGDTLTVSVQVSNTGNRRGSEVVQLYVGTTLDGTGVRRPVRELRGFRKITLEPGEKQEVSFTLSKRAFAHWDVDAHSWRIAGGAYMVQIGRSAEDIIFQSDIAVEEEYLSSGQHYDIMTPVSDVAKHPAGRAFLNKMAPTIKAVISHVDMGAAQEEMPYGELIPKTVGLPAEPLQTIKRMLPMVSETEWAELLKELNQ